MENLFKDLSPEETDEIVNSLSEEEIAKLSTEELQTIEQNLLKLSQPTTEKQPIGVGEAFGLNVVEGASAGFGTELMRGASNSIDKVTGSSNKYTELGIQEAAFKRQQRIEQSREEQKLASLAGGIAGSVASTALGGGLVGGGGLKGAGAALSSIKTGAGVAALTGAGEGQGSEDIAAGEQGNRLTGAAIGATLAVAMPFALKKAGNFIKNMKLNSKHGTEAVLSEVVKDLGLSEADTITANIGLKKFNPKQALEKIIANPNTYLKDVVLESPKDFYKHIRILGTNAEAIAKEGAESITDAVIKPKALASSIAAEVYGGKVDKSTLRVVTRTLRELFKDDPRIIKALNLAKKPVSTASTSKPIGIFMEKPVKEAAKKVVKDAEVKIDGTLLELMRKQLGGAMKFLKSNDKASDATEKIISVTRKKIESLINTHFDTYSELLEIRNVQATLEKALKSAAKKDPIAKGIWDSLDTGGGLVSTGKNLVKKSLNLFQDDLGTKMKTAISNPPQQSALKEGFNKVTSAVGNAAVKVAPLPPTAPAVLRTSTEILNDKTVGPLERFQQYNEARKQGR